MKFCRLPSGFLVAYRTAKLFSRKKFRFEKSTCIPGNLSHAGCLPHSTSWGWLTSAGSAGAAPLWQHTETLRNGGGTDGAALVCARPAPGSGNSFPDGGEEHCKVPCSTSGSGSSVLMYSGLSSTSLWLCGSAAPLLPDLLLACWHSVPSVTGGKDSGKGALPYSLPKK